MKGFRPRRITETVEKVDQTLGRFDHTVATVVAAVALVAIVVMTISVLRSNPR